MLNFCSLDIYLMAASMYNARLTARVLSYKGAVARVFESIPKMSLYHLIPVVNFGFDFVEYFTVDINVTATISCEGMQAPLYLMLNFFIISLVVVLFDSSVFIFLRVSPEDFRLGRSHFIAKRMKMPPESSRSTEQYLIKTAAEGVGRNTKTLIQIVLAKMMLNTVRSLLYPSPE